MVKKLVFSFESGHVGEEIKGTCSWLITTFIALPHIKKERRKKDGKVLSGY